MVFDIFRHPKLLFVELLVSQQKAAPVICSSRPILATQTLHY